MRYNKGMSNRQINIGLLSLSCIGLVASYLILQSDLYASATGDMLVKLGKSLFYATTAMSLVFLVLLFTPQAFTAWKKFAIWFVPLAAILFAVYPDPGSGDLFSPYPEQIFQWVSALYVIISISIITWKSYKLGVWKK